MGESWFNGNTSPCVIYIDRCVGLFLWAASTGPELYINFSLRTIYKHCYVLPIVHVPLTGNICLRMFKKSTKSIKCGGHFQMKQPMPISSPSFFWWSPSKVSRLWPVAGPRVQQAPQLSLGHCYIATSKAHQKFTHIQCGLTWIRVAEMDGYFYI